jgi:hypothetical protein
VRLPHVPGRTHASFDDPNLVSRAGLVPVVALAERCGLADLAAEHVRIAARCGVNAHLKTGCLVAGMAAGADSIDGMDVLRHGAMGELFGGIRAPSTLGSFLRSFTWGNVLQLQKVHREFLAELSRHAPLLPGAGVLAFLDMDSTQERVYGHARQGAASGHTKIAGKTLLVRGLNALAVVISTPLAAPVIAATRLRGGSANSARGAAPLAAEAISTARRAGCTGQIVFRADSACHNAKVLGAIRRAGDPDLARTAGQHLLGPGPIPDVPAAGALACGIVLLIAQVPGHLLIQRGLDHGLGQLLQQPVRTSQRQAALAGNEPEGRWASGPSLQSAKTCPAMAWSRCCDPAWIIPNGLPVNSAW